MVIKINEMDEQNYVTIPEFYAGKSVFITGGAGYLGKVLIEKLLYSCPDLDKVYVLLRDKKNVSAEDRLQNIINLPVFSRLRNEKPLALNKIVLVKGDVSAHNLNMTSEDVETVIEKVSVVIHSAAVVKFNDPLKIALSSNVEGTRNVLNLCHMMRNIQVYVHISTAYSNSNQQVIEELIYPPPVSVDEAYKFAENNPTEADIKKLLNGLPNTYTFTKALAENLVSEAHGDIPAIIIRPSIVTPSKEEPLKGWIDNWYGATGVLTLIAKGFCRAVYTDVNHIIDLIPVDYVCNHTIVAAARAKRQTEVAVFNSCSGSSNPITMKQVKDLYCDEALKNNINELPYPHMSLMTRQYWLVWFITFLTYLVAYIADTLARLSLNRPKYVNLVGHAVKVRSTMDYFTLNSWIMKTDKSSALYDNLSPNDAKTFPFLARNIDWNEYLPVYVQGVRKYLMEKKDKKRV